MGYHRLGVCTWIFGNETLHIVASKIAALGYDGVELKGDLSLYTAAEAKQILRQFGLEVFSLTPDNVDLSHPAEPMRQDAVNYYLHLLDFAAELGQPLISCHGLVGRLAPIDTITREYNWLLQSVRRIAQEARSRGLSVVFELLNRYESHQIQNGTAALQLLSDLGMDNVGILLDAYHMNIEEANPAETIRTVGQQLWLYHAADSNRQAIGRGHTDFAAQLKALDDIGYTGPIIMECTAPGPNPFTPIKGPDSIEWVERYLRESKTWLDRHMLR